MKPSVCVIIDDRSTLDGYYLPSTQDFSSSSRGSMAKTEAYFHLPWEETLVQSMPVVKNEQGHV